MRIELNWQGQALLPGELLDDVNSKKISPGAYVLYGIYFSFGGNQRLLTKSEVAKKMLGCSVSTLRKYEKELEASGWLTIERDSYGQTSVIILNMIKPKRRNQNGRV